MIEIKEKLEELNAFARADCRNCRNKLSTNSAASPTLESNDGSKPSILAPKELHCVTCFGISFASCSGLDLMAEI